MKGVSILHGLIRVFGCFRRYEFRGGCEPYKVKYVRNYKDVPIFGKNVRNL